MYSPSHLENGSADEVTPWRDAALDLPVKCFAPSRIAAHHCFADTGKPAIKSIWMGPPAPAAMPVQENA